MGHSLELCRHVSGQNTTQQYEPFPLIQFIENKELGIAGLSHRLAPALLYASSYVEHKFPWVSFRSLGDFGYEYFCLQQFPEKRISEISPAR